MSDDKFKQELQEFLNKEKGDFLPFKEGIQKHIDWAPWVREKTVGL